MSRRGTRFEDTEQFTESQDGIGENQTNEESASEDEVRDIDTFVADQNRFLQQKRAKEELRKQQ